MASGIGIIEVASIAAGYSVADSLAKAASVEIVEACPICPGKFVVVFMGETSNVRASLEAGVEAAGSHLVASMDLASVHPDVLDAFRATTPTEPLESLGIVETFTISSCVLAADAAAKAASVRLIDVRLARGQGGKSFVSMTGDVAATQAAVDAAKDAISGTGDLVHSVVIPRPHEVLGTFIL